MDVEATATKHAPKPSHNFRVAVPGLRECLKTKQSVFDDELEEEDQVKSAHV